MYLTIFITALIFCTIGIVLGVMMRNTSVIESCDTVGVLRIENKVYSCKNITPIKHSFTLIYKERK